MAARILRYAAAMFHAWWVTASRAVTIAAFASTALACSSGHDAGAPDSAPRDAGAPSDVGVDHHVTKADASHPRDASGPIDSGDDGADCSAASTTSFTPKPYVPAVAHQAVCSPSQIAGFLSACVTTTSSTSCPMWAMANIASDAGPGTPCGNCIQSPDNNGVVWLDPRGGVWPNYGACIQLTDAVHGEACAAAYDNVSACQDLACDPVCTSSGACGTQAACNACGNMADKDGCNKYQGPFSKACSADFADGGAANACMAGIDSDNITIDVVNIATLVCGESPVDGGHD